MLVEATSERKLRLVECRAKQRNADRLINRWLCVCVCARVRVCVGGGGNSGDLTDGWMGKGTR